MIEYDNLELAKAINNANNINEVYKLANIVKYLYNLGESINIAFFEHLAHKRIRLLA